MPNLILRLIPLLLFVFASCTAPVPRPPSPDISVSRDSSSTTKERASGSSVVTVPIDTGLEPAPKRSSEPTPLELPATSEPDAMMPRPADAMSSPYPPAGELMPAPMATPSLEPAIEPTLPAIDYQTAPEPVPTRPLAQRIGDKLFIQPAPPAVVALEGNIENKFKARNYGDAAAEIDRALRIQPKNPELWHVLAEIRLRQNQPALAEDLAKKSNSLAKTSPDLVRSNWRIISDARRQLGNGAGAQEALEKAW